MRRLFTLVILLVHPTVAVAQGDPTVDSAEVARQQWRAAVGALTSGDTAAALAGLSRAADAWPVQPAYVRGLARFAARTGKTDLALRSLERLTALGQGWDPADPAFARLAADPRFTAVGRTMSTATAPLDGSRVLLTVADTLQHVEGAAYDAAGRRWFTSSIRQRKVVVHAADGTARDFIPSGRDGLDATFGLAVDARRGVLWVVSTATAEQTGYTADDDGRSALYAFDLASGALRGRVALPEATGGHMLGDVIVTSAGVVYASDSRAPFIYRIPAGEIPARAEVAVAGAPLFRSVQGMAPAPDGRTMFVADYSHGLLRVDLPTGTVAVLPPPAGATLVGIDGLIADGPRRLIGVQNGIVPARVIRIELSADGKQVERIVPLLRDLPGGGEPTLLTRGPDGPVVVAGSPWANYVDGRPRADLPWPRATLRQLPPESR